MYTVSDLYKRLAAHSEHTREVKAVIAGVEYDQDRIKECSTYCDMLSDLVVGGCMSRELDLIIEPAGDIPRAAKISVFFRVMVGDEKSEWVPGGVFYVDTRANDEFTGWLMLHGVDGLMKTEAIWLDPSIDAGEWPMNQRAAANNIAARIGAVVDSRSAISPDYSVDYPNDFTMREILEEIAAANGGNWIMTGDGELLLAPLGGLPLETSFLVDSQSGGAILMGEVRLIV